jgi:hypothetical protein
MSDHDYAKYDDHRRECQPDFDEERQAILEWYRTNRVDIATDSHSPYARLRRQGLSDEEAKYAVLGAPRP